MAELAKKQEVERTAAKGVRGQYHLATTPFVFVVSTAVIELSFCWTHLSRMNVHRPRAAVQSNRLMRNRRRRSRRSFRWR